MSDATRITAAMEDYLETILRQVYAHKVARSRDIAQSLGVHKSTVTAALKSLGAAGLVNYAPYEAITLTPEGERAARDVWRRHEALRRFLSEVLGLAEDMAETAACAMEHAAPREVVNRMIGFADFLEACPRGGRDWIARIRTHCHDGRDESQCRDCLSRCRADFEQRP